MPASTPPDTSGYHEGARATGRSTIGATARGAPTRKRAAWLIPLLILLALIAAGVILALALRGGSKKHPPTTPTVPNAAGATNTGPSTGTGNAGSTASASSAGSGAAESTTPSVAGSAAGGAAGTSSTGPLVGGGGVIPTAVSGPLAAPGSVGDILFTEAGTALDTSAQTVIASAARQIKASNATSVTVIGYTDTIGDTAANQQLSLGRAQAVVAALQQQIPGSQVQYKALAQGETQAVASNDTPQGRQLNRRVVILSQ